MIDFGKQLQQVVDKYIQKYNLGKDKQYAYAGRFPLSACLSFTSDRLEQQTFQFANEIIYSDIQQLSLADDWLSEQIGDIDSSPQLCLHFKLHQLADQLQQAMPLQYKIQDNAGQFFDTNVYMPFELSIDSGQLVRHTILPIHQQQQPAVIRRRINGSYVDITYNVEYTNGFIRFDEEQDLKFGYQSDAALLDIYGSAHFFSANINCVQYNNDGPIKLFTSGGVFYSFKPAANNYVLQHLEVKPKEYILNYPVQYRRVGTKRIAYIKSNQIYAPVISITLI